MTVSACPIATIAAPMERVWEMLTNPVTYSEWWDATTQRIEPPGRATPGQIISATSRALGRSWPVTTTVLAVDDARRVLELRTRLPLGIVVQNHLICHAVDATSCRLTFG